MKKRILILGIALALIATMVVPMSALATNTANQNASTYSIALEIVNKENDAAVSTIVFPPGVVNTEVINPFNNFDGPADPQVLSGTVSEPVVRLKNTSKGKLQVWLQIDGWTGGVVAAEFYKLVGTCTKNVSAVTKVLSPDGNDKIVATGVKIPKGCYLDLYLKVVLSDSEGVSGSSTLTILGGAP